MDYTAFHHLCVSYTIIIIITSTTTSTIIITIIIAQFYISALPADHNAHLE
jgi:hypothetical protein